jgi:hypothetical protein
MAGFERARGVCFYFPDISKDNGQTYPSEPCGGGQRKKRGAVSGFAELDGLGKSGSLGCVWSTRVVMTEIPAVRLICNCQEMSIVSHNLVVFREANR